MIKDTELQIKNIWVILFTFLIFTSGSLAITISGVVVDSLTGETLPGATVRVKDTPIGTYADETGSFALNIDNISTPPIILAMHLIGYKDKTIQLDNLSDVSDLTIRLASTLWKLDMVVVTATRREYILKDVPITTELITSEEFAETGALTVDQALESHIGVDITDDLSGKGVTLRGIDPTRVLVLMDGERLIGRVRGSLDMGQISLANVDRIEIVKGSGATLYGSDAIGGVVNIITKKPSGLNSLDLYSSYGSFNSYDFQSGISTGILGKGMFLTAKYEHTDGFDLDKTTEHTNGLENIDRFNINNKVTFGLAAGLNLDLSMGVMIEDKQWIESEIVQIGVDRYVTYNFDDYERNYRYSLASNLRWAVDPKADFNFGVHGSYYDHIWKKYTRSNVWVDTSKTDDDIYGASFQYNRQLSDRHMFTFGGDIETQGLKSDQLATGSERVVYEDFYAQYEWRSLSRVSLLPGIRWEHHETYGHHFSPSLNVMWNACSYFNLRMSLSEGYRAPSLKELYFEFDHIAAGYKVIGGGEELDPETSTNYSITAEINYNKKAMHRLSYFRNDLRNLIEFSDGDFSDPAYWRGIYYYDNIVKARTEGIEWETQIDITDDLDLSFSYTYMTAENLTDSTKLINRPEHTFKFNTGYTFNFIDTRLSFWGFYQDHKLWTSQGDTPERESDVYAPSRWNLNAGIARELLDGLDLFVKLENLTDEKNAEFGYWPERSYKVSLNYNFNRSK